MSKIGVLQGTISDSKSFPYATWKSEFEKVNNLEVDFLDWIVDANPVPTFYNFLFSSRFKNRIAKNNFKKEIRSVYCECFNEYKLLACDSSEKLYKRISILEKIITAAKNNKIEQIIIPIFEEENILTQKQIDNIVFILRMSLRNIDPESQKIVIETNLHVNMILEILHKVDSNNTFLSLPISYLINLSKKKVSKVKKYLINVTIDIENDNCEKIFKFIRDIDFSGHFLITNHLFLMNKLDFLKKQI